MTPRSIKYFQEMTEMRARDACISVAIPETADDICRAALNGEKTLGDVLTRAVLEIRTTEFQACMRASIILEGLQAKPEAERPGLDTLDFINKEQLAAIVRRAVSAAPQHTIEKLRLFGSNDPMRRISLAAMVGIRPLDVDNIKATYEIRDTLRKAVPGIKIAEYYHGQNVFENGAPRGMYLYVQDSKNVKMSKVIEALKPFMTEEQHLEYKLAAAKIDE